MRSPKYTVLIANRQTGAVRRMTVARRPVALAVIGVLCVPVLMGLGARWSGQAEITRLAQQTDALRIENDSYRAATGELAAQISTLQTAITELGEDARLDPAAKRAIDNLPALVKNRAMGVGGGGAAATTPPVTASLGSPNDTFGILQSLLGSLEARLETVRTGVEKQQALAAATPSIWPVVGYLSSMFGSRKDPFTGGPDFHPGLDIAAQSGTPIRSTADGTVESSGYSGNYGNAVVVRHGFGISTRYGHMSRITARTSQQVKRGDIIGYVGSTGRATSAHLHYEILLNGQTINPLRLLARP
ncbi:MAG TPA: M23 family metallopeptidase [Vicinamibacterales bacterium]|nr:M23 family metallopeptidase [Acidobacteriota bacterium]HQX82350.1 M23 family metallopeptidase [Vicinamibacterales bacterium]